MKKTIRRIAPAMLVLFGLSVLFGCSSQSKLSKEGTTLRLHPEKGKTYTATSKANMMTMMEVQGQTMNMSQNMETRQSFTALEVSDAQSVIKSQIDAIKMSISQMGMKLEYDSEHPEKTSPMLAGQTQQLQETLNKPVEITYDAMGRITNDSIDMVTNPLGNVIIELPEKNVTVGSSWNTKKTQEVSGIEINVNMGYTVTGISKNNVDVSFNGTIESTEVTGSYNGTASINPQTGITTSILTKSNISMTHNEQGLSIPMTIVGTTTVEVK